MLSSLTNIFDLPAILMPKRDPRSEKDLHFNVYQPHYGYKQLYEKEMTFNRESYKNIRVTNKVLDKVIAKKTFYTVFLILL